MVHASFSSLWWEPIKKEHVHAADGEVLHDVLRPGETDLREYRSGFERRMHERVLRDHADCGDAVLDRLLSEVSALLLVRGDGGGHLGAHVLRPAVHVSVSRFIDENDALWNFAVSEALLDR